MQNLRLTCFAAIDNSLYSSSACREDAYCISFFKYTELKFAAVKPLTLKKLHLMFQTASE